MMYITSSMFKSLLLLFFSLSFSLSSSFAAFHFYNDDVVQTIEDTIIKISENSILQKSISATDTIIKGNLADVIVKAFEQNRRLQDVPAAVSYIGTTQLARYNNTSVLAAVNSVPGVRMEERSPGSYRLNIRGSSMRSPFGVRNVKVYYNNIPITDPGGQTYLNQLGFYNVQSIEIIKGPGSSLYGAGTGGALLIDGASPKGQLVLNYSTGSYGLQNIHVSAAAGTKDFSNVVSYQHQTSNGYRQHTKMRRDMFAWNSSIRTSENNQITTTFLYGDLFYQTPGALTLAEYDQNPRSARPAIGNNPGAVETKAAIYQKTFLAGATYKQTINNHLQNTTSLYGAYTQVRNPTFRNYGRNNEPHFGGRTTFQFKKDINNNDLIIHVGAELQQGFTSSRVFSNKNGNPDTLQTDDEINNRQAFVFSQISYQHKQWLITAGASINQLKVDFMRLSNAPVTNQRRRYNNELAPRLAILYKVADNTSVYGTVAKGFSPPTTAEILPSTGIINTGLNAEQGINYEAGVKGSFINERLSYDINAFFFKLRNTIVQRRDASGGDFFINAGSTDQKGFESMFNYRLNSSENDIVKSSGFWLSYTWNKFNYKDFKQLTNDFSGNQLPGSVPHTITAGLDLHNRSGLYFHLTYLYSDAIFLNDANSVRSDSYHLAGSRFGFNRKLSDKYSMDVFGGVDNMLNETYSLGNDVNAFGGRYYNAAPRRNFYAGISLRSAKK